MCALSLTRAQTLNSREPAAEVEVVIETTMACAPVIALTMRKALVSDLAFLTMNLPGMGFSTFDLHQIVVLGMAAAIVCQPGLLARCA